MILKLIRWVRGYVVFAVSGRFPERFINLLNINGIVYWDLLPEKGGYRGTMLLSDYRSIRSLARRADVRLRVKKRMGLVFFIRKYRRRKGLFIGAVVAALLIAFLSQFIWVVRFDGASSLSESELRKVLSDSGFHVGVLKSAVDFDSLERNMLLKFPEIRWLSINTMNNVATVEIREKHKAPEPADISKPCNIKAAFDGVITKTTVYNGKLETQKGSAVSKNQLLVSAVIEGTNEDLTYVHSDAEIFADVRVNKEFDIPVKNYNIVNTDNYIEKSKANLLWFSFPWKLAVPENGVEVNNFYTYALSGGGVNLPLGKSTTHSFYLQQNENILTDSKAKELLRKQSALYECFCEPKSRVKSRDVKYLISDDSATVKVNYVFNKDIGVEQELVVKR